MDFPSIIGEFGYEFNDEGELRHKETGGGFEFNVRPDDRGYNQRRYEALGECITQHVYKLLESECGLEKVNVPLDATEGEPVSFIFRSPDFKTNSDKLMVLIHGSGVVRAGQWARRLIINVNLQSGTQIPYIKRAMAEGYSVIVLNTNENKGLSMDGEIVPIRGSSTPEEHALYVWEHLVKESPAEQVFVVAHSYGGKVVFSLANDSVSTMDRITKIAFTDSVQSRRTHEVDEKTFHWMKERTINWVSSQWDLDDDLTRPGGDSVKMLSAGVMAHEETSHAAFDSVFKFFSSSTLLGLENLPTADSEVSRDAPATDGAGDTDDTRTAAGTDDSPGKKEELSCRDAEVKPTEKDSIAKSTTTNSESPAAKEMPKKTYAAVVVASAQEDKKSPLPPAAAAAPGEEPSTPGPESEGDRGDREPSTEKREEPSVEATCTIL